MLLIMRSHLSSANLNCFAQRSPLSLFRMTPNPTFRRLRPRSYCGLELSESGIRKHGLRHWIGQVRAMDEDFSSLDDWEDDDILVYMHSSNEVEEGDGDDLLNPLSDIDLPTVREPFLATNDALTGTAYRLAMLARGRKKSRVKHGVIINIGLVAFLIVLLGLVDCCAWRIVRLPLEPFYLMRPFCISAVVVSCAGFVCIPLLRSLKIRSIIRQEGPVRRSSKTGTPTMGGLFFVPIGIIVAEVVVGFSSIEVTGAAAATLAFAAIERLGTFQIIENIAYCPCICLLQYQQEVLILRSTDMFLVTGLSNSLHGLQILKVLRITNSPVGAVCFAGATAK